MYAKEFLYNWYIYIYNYIYIYIYIRLIIINFNELFIIDDMNFLISSQDEFVVPNFLC